VEIERKNICLVSYKSCEAQMGRTASPGMPEEAVVNEQPSIALFFPAKKRWGRPKKTLNDDGPAKKKGRGHPPKAKEAQDGDDGVVVDSRKQALPLQTNKGQSTRVNWSSGAPLEKLEEAVKEWDENGPLSLDENDEKMSKCAYAHSVAIPYHTLYKYINDDKSKRRSLGASVGRQRIVPVETSELLAQCAARADRGNDGKSRKEMIDLLQDVQPELSREQAANTWDRTLKDERNKYLKPKLMRAQATTTKRSAITVEQQYRWFTTYNNAVDFLREKNTGRCKKTGRLFGEVIEHFIVGGDETCFIANAGGLQVYGSRDRGKHEKKTDDSRVSITVYRIGSVAGTNGPAFFLMAGKNIKSGFTDFFLEKHGAAKHSTIIMTENAYMTDEAWDRMTPKVIEGIRALPFIAENPEWFVLEVFDGFSSHTSGYRACVRRYDSKILALKEEGDSSHVNQGYDKFVAKNDKAVASTAAGSMRSAKCMTKGKIGQWDLVLSALAAIRATTIDLWRNSYIACNMNPTCQLPFVDWCKKISNHLQAGQTFKSELFRDDPYLLLPTLWHGTIPEDKKKIMGVLEKHESA
jgi:hypothetical protein